MIQKAIQKLWVFLVLIYLVSSAHALSKKGSNQTNQNKAHANQPDEKQANDQQISDKVWIKQPDGGIACEDPKDAKSLDQGMAVLKKAGIEVFESKKMHDGFMRASVCGIPTGNENTYLISKSQLQVALKLGFQQLKSP